MIKTDCFAYKKRMCSVLTEMVCRYGCCSFYKTKAQDASDRIKYKTNEKYSQKGALK